MDKVGKTSGLQFLSILMGYFADAILFQYQIQPFEFVGAGMIIACSIVIFAMKAFNYS